jgi:2-iminoacetate synthase ThiH
MIGRQLQKALDRAGLTELAARALSGQGLGPADIAALERADLLVLAGLADAVRRQHRGDEVRMFGGMPARREPQLVRLTLESGHADGPTGAELLREVALARLRTPGDQSVGVNYEQLGLELAQVALTFGADALIGDLESKRTLPLLSGSAARRQEITGLIERAGRRVKWIDAQPVVAPAAESPR